MMEALWLWLPTSWSHPLNLQQNNTRVVSLYSTFSDGWNRLKYRANKVKGDKKISSALTYAPEILHPKKYGSMYLFFHISWARADVEQPLLGPWDTGVRTHTHKNKATFAAHPITPVVNEPVNGILFKTQGCARTRSHARTRAHTYTHRQHIHAWFKYQKIKNKPFIRNACRNMRSLQCA